MHDISLIGPYNPDDVMAWEQRGPRTAGQFLSDAFCLAEALPDRPTVLNLAADRYKFLVGFAAAILRGHVTLLPQSRAPQSLHCLARDYPGSYALTDQCFAIEGIETVPIQPGSVPTSQTRRIPHVPLDQVVAIAFTSGSTGRPMANRKTWRALTSVAHATGTRLGIKSGDRAAVVATVPHQHMFGLEASIMLPIVHGLVMHTGRPFFPTDIQTALDEVSGRRILVTTPLHLRACVLEGMGLPPGGLVLSATAPLARSLAEQAEQCCQTEVHEIFGFAEAGSVAERRTIEGDRWRPLDGVRIVQDQGTCFVQASYLPAPIPVPDRISVDAQGTFVVHGRQADQVNVAGLRVSLGDLNQKLLEIDGVQDGVFLLPEGGGGLVTRLMAFVVAPGKTSEEIQHALRAHIDPVFLPRPLVCVPSLPRNETGKLPQELAHELVRHWLGKAES